MSRRLDMAFSTKKDAEIVRYLQLKEPNRSVIIVSAIEYYLQTGKNIIIGSVCTDKLSDEAVQRVALRVPEESLTAQWVVEQLRKNQKGLLKTKISNILHKSISTIPKEETEYTRSYEDIVDEMERAENASKRIETTTFNVNESPIHVVEPIQSQPAMSSAPKKENKPAKASQTMMDKLMPKFED